MACSKTLISGAVHVHEAPHHRGDRLVRAGTTTVHTFEGIFWREKVNAAIIEGDSFHRYTRDEIRELIIDAKKTRASAGSAISAPEANLLEELGTALPHLRRIRAANAAITSITPEEAARRGLKVGDFTPGKTSRRTPTVCSTKACTAR